MSQFCKFTVRFVLTPYEWSETHYFTQNLNTSDRLARQQALGYASARALILGSGVSILSVEIADDANPQSTVYVSADRPVQPAAPMQGVPPGPTGPGPSPQPPGLPEPRIKPLAIPPGLGPPPPPPVPTSTQFISTRPSSTSFAELPAGVAYNPMLNAVAAQNVAAGELAGIQSDFPYANVLVRKEAVSGPVVYHASLFLAGNPDYIQAASLQVPTNPVWLDGWDELLSYLAFGHSPYGMKVKSRDQTSSPEVSITNVEINAQNQWVYQANAPVPWAQGDQVHIRGVKGSTASQVNGQRFVTGLPTPSSWTMSGPTPPPGWSWVTGGLAQKVSYVVVGYTNWIMKAFTHRKRGVKEANLKGSKAHKRSTST